MLPRNYFSKEDFILNVARGRRVLHLGCVGFSDLSTHERVETARHSLHWTLTEIANVVGVDYSPAVVKEWRTLGIFTNIVAGDVEKLGELRLRGPFDVVVAGDIIEHLSNPGMMLDGVRALCTAESSLIITTPNAFGLPNYGRFLLVYRRERTRPHIQQRHIVESTETPWIQNRKCGHLLQPLSVARRGLLFRLGRFVLERVPRLGGTLLLVARIQESLM